MMFIILDTFFLEACFAKYFVKITGDRRFIFKWSFQLLLVKFEMSSFSNNAALLTKQSMVPSFFFTNGIIFSQRVMIELTKNGFSREKAYAIVQENAQNCWKKNITFYESLSNDSYINKKISNKELRKMFDLKFHTKYIDTIFKRVFK